MKTTVRFHLCVLIVYAIATTTYAQSLPPDVPQVIPATPNATRITEYYAQRPNMYTGTANVSIPLYTIDFDGWKLPISISYNATGIRTNEEAGEIGLGWALNATGVISRVVNGGDDLFPGPNQGNGGKGYVYDAPINSNINPSGTYYSHLAQHTPDTQPDIFNYNFFGYSGSFALTQKTLGSIRATKLTQDACAIHFNEDTKTFIIITPQGFKGYFETTERTTSLSSYAAAGVTTSNWLTCCEENYINLSLATNNGRVGVTSTWYLSRILSPRGDAITFEYDMEGGRSNYVSLNKAFAEFNSLDAPRICLQTIQEHVYLKSITSDEVIVNFSMEVRDDLRMNTLFTKEKVPANPFPVAKKLRRYSSIRIQGVDPASTLDKKIVFTQSYFNQAYHNILADNENEVRWLRSRLDRLTIDDQEYNFYYENPNDLPDKLTTAVDHFGFYNGIEQNERMLLPPDATAMGNPDNVGKDLSDTSRVNFYSQRSSRRSNFDFAKNGVLTKIVYPTRGYSLYKYESHTYVPDQTIPFRESLRSVFGNDAGGVRIKEVSTYDYNDSLASRKEYVYRESYTEHDSPSSGRLMTPLFNRYAARYQNEQSNGFEFKYRTHTGIPGGNSAQGRIIGYSTVHEIVHGHNDFYRNVYHFENRPNRVSSYNAVATGWPNLNGQLIEVINYNSNGEIVQRTNYLDYYHQETDPVIGIVYEPQPSKGEVLGFFLNYAVPYRLERTFIAPKAVVTTTCYTGGANKEVQVLSSFNSNYLVKTQEVWNSKGELLKTEFRRATDYQEPSSVLQWMGNPLVNIVEPIIEQISSKDKGITNAIAYRYELNDKVRVDLSANFVWNPELGTFKPSPDGSSFPLPYELKTTYDKYGQGGKILQYTPRDGLTNSFIWGYRNKLPVVRGVGISHSLLNQAYVAASGATDPDLAIRSHKNTDGSQITSFKHNPLVGIATMVDANGIRKIFNYDRFGRLESIVDNNGNTVEQYQYHFRERSVVKSLSIPTTLDFGTQVQDYFQPTFYQYEKCGSPIRKLTVKNTGEVDVSVTRIELPTGYSCAWKGGSIASGVTVEIIVTFNELFNLPSATYNGTINIFADTPQSVYSTAVTGRLIERDCKITTAPATVDFGETIDSFEKIQLTATNNGNGSLRIIDTKLSFGWGDNNSIYDVEYFYIRPNPVCLSQGSVQTFDLAFRPPASGEYSAVLSLVTDTGCPATKLQLRGKRRPADEARMISLDVPAVEMKITTEKEISKQVRISNPGVYTLHVTGISSDMPDNSFSISETNFHIEPGAEKVVTVSFQPAPTDFKQHLVKYTFNSDKTRGNGELIITARREILRKVVASAPSMNFNYANQIPKTVSITNIGNQDISFNGDGVSYVFGVPGGGYSSPENTSVYWSAEVSNAGSSLRPGQSTILSARLLPGFEAPLRQFVRVDYGKTDGVADTYIELIADTRILGYPSSPITMQSKEAAFTQSLPFFNFGNMPLLVRGYNSTDKNFTISQSAFPVTISPFGGKISLEVVCRPKDFSSHSTTLTLDSDASGFRSKVSSVTINAQRTMVLELTALRPDNNTGNWIINFSQQARTGSVKNTGNVPLVVNTVQVFDTNPTSEEFKVEVPPGTSFPLTLAPGAFLFITLKSNRGYSTNATGTIRVTYEGSKMILIDVQRVR